MNKIYVFSYGLLLIISVLLIISTEFFGPVYRENVLPVAIESFKMVFAAALGALSVLIGKKNKGDK
jgi:hypothetical protein